MFVMFFEIFVFIYLKCGVLLWIIVLSVIIVLYFFDFVSFLYIRGILKVSGI